MTQETLTPGTPVTFAHFGAILTGTVTRDSGTDIVWVQPDGTARVIWKHRESLNVITAEKPAKDFCFSITNGVDGYLPDNVDFYRFDNADDALTAICDAIRNFREGGFNDVDPDATFTECQWRHFFERGCSAPDASVWSFRLAEVGREILSLNGLTAAEYEREQGE